MRRTNSCRQKNIYFTLSYSSVFSFCAHRADRFPPETETSTCPTIVSQQGPLGTSEGCTVIGGAVELSGTVPLYRLACQIVIFFFTMSSSALFEWYKKRTLDIKMTLRRSWFTGTDSTTQGTLLARITLEWWRLYYIWVPQEELVSS